MTRKLVITQADVLRAKAEGMSATAVAKARLPKRGRPVGSKNKSKPVSSFAQTLKKWDEKEKEVDFKELCQKLQEALAKAYCDIDQLEQHLSYVRNELQARDVVIRYLESRKA